MENWEKTKFKIKFVQIAMCLIFIGLSLYQISSAVIAAGDNKLIINGSHIEVNESQIKDEIEVSFTFKTVGNEYDGFAGGTYAVQWDPTQMDLVANSMSQDASTLFNYDWTSFVVNGNPGVEGMVLVHNSGASSQEKTLRMKFTNLFKDGNFDRPAEVKVINRNEDLFVVGTVGNPVGEIATNVIINNTKITAIPIRFEIVGENNVIKGAGTSYQANVENAASNAVTWSINGQNSTLTAIDQNGVLSVGNDETATQIEIIATLNEDINKSASKIVNIIDKSYTITNIELPVPSATVETDILKSGIVNIANKNQKARITIETNTGQTAIIEVDINDYNLPIEMIDTNGKLIVGNYQITYTLKLPYITIDSDGNVIVDNSKETNLLGEATVSMNMKVEEKKVNNDESGDIDNEGKNDNNTNSNNNEVNNNTQKNPSKNNIKTTDKKKESTAQKHVRTNDTSMSVEGLVIVMLLSGLECFVFYKKGESKKI